MAFMSFMDLAFIFGFLSFSASLALFLAGTTEATYNLRHLKMALFGRKAGVSGKMFSYYFWFFYSKKISPKNLRQAKPPA
jgi:hypothetical protein